MTLASRRCVVAVIVPVALVLCGRAFAEGPDLEVPEIQPAEFEVQLRGYFRAKTDKKDERALGGFAESDNTSESLEGNLAVWKSEVYLQVLPERTTRFRRKYRGMVVRLINGTDERVWFEASDGRLNIVQEAKGSDGDWRAVEYLPSSWCGNSYHRVALNPGRYWHFTAPRYTGPFETKLRIRLKRDGAPDLYSETFEGAIHKTQFHKKQPHEPSSVMDPYHSVPREGDGGD